MGRLGSPRSAGEGEAEPWGCPMNSPGEADSCLQRSPVGPEYYSLHQNPERASLSAGALVLFQVFQGYGNETLGEWHPGLVFEKSRWTPGWLWQRQMSKLKAWVSASGSCSGASLNVCKVD